MNAITGLTYLTEKNIDNPEIVKENIKKISLAGNHLVTLINDILDISKVESGKITLNPSNFSIVETIENLINISEPMIKDKGLDFRLHINNFEKEYLFDDQLRLNQIFINILSNAIKYTESGGKVYLDIYEEESDKPGYVKLTYIVEDTGIGMSKEFMDKMYEPFIRQTDSRLNSIEGTGLGLSITKKMVSLMGGTIDCESELGKGTKFTIVLDLKISDINIDMKLNPIDILIIDKDEFELETASSIIKSLGANPNICNNNKEAYDLINERDKQFDVILIDSNSFDDEFIKNINNLIDKKTILLISSFDLNEIENSFDNKSIGFIKKPLFKSKLYYKINEMLGNDKNIINKEDDYSDLKGLNVLIAEDNDINYEIISQMLDMIGINTERAIDGEDCLNKIISSEENKYQLIFMDIQMPKMNGLDVTKNIRNLDTWAKSIPIVAMTADAFSENIAECLNVGMNGHIAKPIDFKLVIKEIRKIKEK
jgi:CheY-like chemotaxis protein/two-component sensor histidine kinase